MKSNQDPPLWSVFWSSNPVAFSTISGIFAALCFFWGGAGNAALSAMIVAFGLGGAEPKKKGAVSRCWRLDIGLNDYCRAASVEYCRYYIVNIHNLTSLLIHLMLLTRCVRSSNADQKTKQASMLWSFSKTRWSANSSRCLRGNYTLCSVVCSSLIIGAVCCFFGGNLRTVEILIESNRCFYAFVVLASIWQTPMFPSSLFHTPCTYPAHLSFLFWLRAGASRRNLELQLTTIEESPLVP